ncbi:MAG: hypothetical protein PHD51_02570 [Patescibacteria group bacterium]|nr:hypothetical protein [Patescibacteria group bacterium]MDD5490258.1 hypothetical protein [Patescibacteria group bacterium]
MMPEDYEKNIDLPGDFNTYGAEGGEGEKEERRVKPASKGKANFIFAAVFILAITGVALGFSNYYNNIKGPFVFKGSENEEASGSVNKEAQDSLDLRNKDTDSDGLNDYDELYVYNTSPYLDDSDSDNYKDKEEIDKGYDPNCPAGRVCISSPSESSTATEETATNLTAAEEEILNQGQKLLSGSLSLDELRALLKEMGMSAAQVDSLSDEDLKKLYDKTLQEVQKQVVAGESSSGTAETQNGESTKLPASDSITPEQIRQLLIAGGMKESDLEGISDEELIKLYKEATEE